MNTPRVRRTMTIDSLEPLDERLVLSAISPHPIAATTHPVYPIQVPHASQRPIAIPGHQSQASQLFVRPFVGMIHSSQGPPVSAPPTVAPGHPAPVSHTSVTSYSPNGTAMDKAGQTLNIIHQEYAAYQQGGSQGAFVSSQARLVMITDTSVGVDIRVAGDVNVVAGQLKQIGMVVTAVDANTGTVEGSLPIGQIPAAVNAASVIGLSPMFRPTVK